MQYALLIYSRPGAVEALSERGSGWPPGRGVLDLGTGFGSGRGGVPMLFVKLAADGSAVGSQAGVRGPVQG